MVIFWGFSMFKRLNTYINPTRELLKKVLDDEVIKEKIQIIVERKDVIYSLTSKDIRLL